MSMNNIHQVALQKKLDLPGEDIDTLTRDKESAGDDDLPGDIEEAKEFLRMAPARIMPWRPTKRVP